MEKEILTYEVFISQYYEECRAAAWFPEVMKDCHDLETAEETVSSLIGCIHEGLRANFAEAIKFFWTVFLINPLVAIKAYQETDLLLGKIDLYGTFKHLTGGQDGFASGAIYNVSEEYYMVFAIEALLQKRMNPEELQYINDHYLNSLYEHDKNIMNKKSEYIAAGIAMPPKWINHRNLGHILNNIDPHHIIVLLEFFADRYGARLKQGNVGRYCYSRDKYEYIIRFIKRRYGSLSEYIEWDNISYNYHYRNYYKRAKQHWEMEQYMDVIFPTTADKERISSLAY